MGLREVTFDRQDPSTRELLRRIGLDEKRIDQGAIREDDSTIRFELMQDLASVEEMRVDDYLSLEEARHHLRSLNAFETQYPGFSVAGLFKKGFCPTDETPLRKSLGDKSDEEVVTHSALTLSRNLFWRFTLPIDVQNAEGVLPLAQCPFNPILPAGLLKNVHFSTRFSPPEVDRVARAVGRVTLKNRQVAMQASAVSISPKGHIVTAYHALFHEGRFLTKVQLQFGERTFEVHREHILAAYPGEDLVLLQIPGAEDLPFIEIAPDPPGEEEAVWLIGFPGIKGREPAEDPPQQAFSVAQVSAVHEELLAFDPGVPQGYSGGAVVDQRGRLIGIISFKFLYDMWTLSFRVDSRRGEIMERISGKKPPDDAPYLRLENRLTLMTGASLGKDPDATFVLAVTPIQFAWNRGSRTQEVKLALDGVRKWGASEGFVTRARVGLSHNRLPRLGFEGDVYAGYANGGDLVLGAVAGLFLNRFSWGTPGLYIDYGESLGMGDNPATRILAAGFSYQYNH